MTYGVVQFVAEVAGVSGLAASRPALTLLVIQLAFLLREKLAEGPPPPHHWLASPVAVGVGLLAVILEIVIEHEDDLEELLRHLHLDKVLRAACVVATTQLLITEGLASPDPLVPTVIPTWKQVGIVAGAVGLNLALTMGRGWLLSRLGDLGIKRIWQRLETGGVVVFLGLLLVSPVLVIAILGGLVLCLAAAGLVVRAVDLARDRASRQACPHCQERIRVEATRCKKCHGEVMPARWLADEDGAMDVPSSAVP